MYRCRLGGENPGRQVLKLGRMLGSRVQTGRIGQHMEEIMKGLKLVLMAMLLALPLALAPVANAQVAVGVGVGPAVVAAPVAYGPPDCEWGYYAYYPYGCAPYGYYGPNWFLGGVFIGAGPWYHWGWYGHPGFYGYRGGFYGARAGYYGGYRGGYGGYGYRGGVAPHAFNGGGAYHGGVSAGGHVGGFAGGGGFHGGGFGGGGGFHGGGGGGHR